MRPYLSIDNLCNIAAALSAYGQHTKELYLINSELISRFAEYGFSQHRNDNSVTETLDFMLKREKTRPKDKVRFSLYIILDGERITGSDRYRGAYVLRLPSIKQKDKLSGEIFEELFSKPPILTEKKFRFNELDQYFKKGKHLIAHSNTPYDPELVRPNYMVY